MVAWHVDACAAMQQCSGLKASRQNATLHLCSSRSALQRPYPGRRVLGQCSTMCCGHTKQAQPRTSSRCAIAQNAGRLGDAPWHQWSSASLRDLIAPHMCASLPLPGRARCCSSPPLLSFEQHVCRLGRGGCTCAMRRRCQYHIPSSRGTQHPPGELLRVLYTCTEAFRDPHCAP